MTKPRLFINGYGVADVAYDTRTAVVPLVGSISGGGLDLADRNFYVTDGKTYIEYHFCASIHNVAIPANTALFNLPAFAQGKSIQYGVIGKQLVDSSVESHFVANVGNDIVTADPISSTSNAFVFGNIRLSLLS